MSERPSPASEKKGDTMAAVSGEQERGRRSRLWPLLNGLVHGGIRLLRGRIIIIIIKC